MIKTAELEKLPRTWTSFYEMEKKEGKLKTKDRFHQNHEKGIHEI
jgi:hypothetical protein